MDPMTLMALSSIANIGGGLLGDAMSGGDRDKASAAAASIADLYKNINIPDIESQKVNPALYNAGAQMVAREATPEQLAMQDNLQNISLDPRLKDTQMSALETLKQIAGAGFTPDELAGLTSQRGKREADLTSQLKGINQQQQMRGIASSDAGLAEKLLAAQAGANRTAEEARALEAQGFKRSLDAISQGANLAGNIDNTDYTRQAALAQNLNNRELVNLNQRANVNNSNVDRFNKALEYNLNRTNTVDDKNVATSNNAQAYNKELLQNQFNNTMTLAGAKSGVATGQANMYNQQADRTAGKYAGIGAGLGEMFGAGATMAQKKADQKPTVPGTVTAQVMPFGTETDDDPNDLNNRLRTS